MNGMSRHDFLNASSMCCQARQMRHAIWQRTCMASTPRLAKAGVSYDTRQNLRFMLSIATQGGETSK
jgi:hypothetical protein